MRRFIFRPFFFFLFFALVALSQMTASGKKDEKKKQEPLWLHSVSDIFPQDRYITAIGNGKTLQEAADCAKSNLCSYIKQEVESTVVFTQNANDTTAQNNFFQQVKTQTSLPSFSGLDTTNFFQEDKDSFYVLATLDTDIAGKDLDERIRLLAQKAIDFSQKALQKKGTFLGGVFAISSMEQARQAQELMSFLSCVNDSYYETAKLSLDEKKLTMIPNIAAECLDSFDIEIDISAKNSQDMDCTKRMEKELAKTLSCHGMKAFSKEDMEHNGNACFLEGSVEIVLVDFQGGNKFARYEVSLSIFEAKTRQQVISFFVSGREGHLTQEQAQERAEKKAIANSCLELEKQLENLILHAM